MPTNEFLAFATGAGANVESQADYAADPQLSIGQQPGVAKSALNNKALRQATYIVSCLAQFLANTTGNDVLDDGVQAEVLATMALAWPSGVTPTVTDLTITGATAGYLFTCSTANATLGATYTNNGHTYTVLATLASSTLLFCSGASAPTSSGTLTKASGTGDSTITFSANQPLAQYTTPANVKYLKLKMAGPGGGGSGTNGSGGQGGSAGTITAFGSNLVICTGGAGGAAENLNGGAGGVFFINSPALKLIANNGGDAPPSSHTNNGSGFSGASNALGGAGVGGLSGDAGGNAVANTGAGGGAAGSAGSVANGGAGASGAYIEAIIPTPAASYYYCIGVKGTGGTSTNNGGDGADGIISLEEHYSG